VTVPPRILDPHAVPVAGHDGHLDPIEPSRLTAEALRERFRRPAPFDVPLSGDGGAAALAGGERSSAAVLIGLVQHPDALHVLLTRRTEHLRDHAGQISFPGGRSDPGDADAIATALREAHEEVGLQARHIEVLGTLPLYATATGYLVTPVVALVDDAVTLELDRFEVDEVFEPPLAFLMDPAFHERRVAAIGRFRRSFYAIPWTGGRRYFIWGATAAMLRNLYGLLAA
jgi:8-oxo-dGTP pyrophosphatase MutT (NUDIX family)